MNGPDAGGRGATTPITSALCLDDASYVLGSLSPADRQTYEQHLASCAACQSAVARLAGLPGLLGLTSVAELEADADSVPVPDTLLPRLLTVAARERRRRRWIWTGTAAAAAACVAALVITIVLRPTTGSSADPLPQAVAMQALQKGPMTVSLQLVDKKWGTSIVINCDDRAVQNARAYQLVVFDAAGKAQPAGWWMSVPGAKSTVWAASSWRLNDISRLEVQLPTGQPVLAAVPRHS